MPAALLCILVSAFYRNYKSDPAPFLKDARTGWRRLIVYLLRNKDKNLLTFEIIKKETEDASPATTTAQVVGAYQVRVDSLCEDVARLPLQMRRETRAARLGHQMRVDMH